MKKIPLTQNKFSLVDDEDYDLLSKYKWSLSGNGYAQGWVDKKVVYMHRMIMGFDSPEIDHINRNKIDNRRSNLRFCTGKQNLANTGMRKNNKSGYKGVDYVKRLKKWRVRVLGRHFGLFETPEEAAVVYNQEIKKIFGNIVFQNEIGE